MIASYESDNSVEVEILPFYALVDRIWKASRVELPGEDAHDTLTLLAPVKVFFFGFA